MDLLKRVDELEKELNTLVKAKRFDEVARIIFAASDEAYASMRTVISEKAERVLRIKEWINWPHGHYYHKEDREDKSFLQKHFDWEIKLLEARHERRVARLWKEAKPRLEERYDQPFECREELAMLHRLFDRRDTLERQISRLKKIYQKVQIREEIARKHPGVGWEEIVQMWRRNRYHSDVAVAADNFVCFLRDVNDPGELVEALRKREESESTDLVPAEELEDLEPGEDHRDNLLNTSAFGCGHTSIIKNLDYDPDVRGDFGKETLDSLSASILAGKRGGLDFRKALNYASYYYAELSGMQISGDEDVGFCRVQREFRQLPKILKGFVDEVFKKSYENMKPNDQCHRFIRWMADVFLQRWKSTAMDYERLFSFHTPNMRDVDYMKFFHWIREGKKAKYNDERIFEGRLPELLRLLVADGVITEEEIDPPLREKYLLPDQLLNSRKKLLTDGKSQLEERFKFKPQEKPKLIATTANPTKLIPEWTGGNLPVRRNDFAELGAVLKPDTSYYALYKGNHTLFIAAEVYYPSGSPRFTGIHRLTLLPEGAEPEEGSENSVVTIRDQRFLVKPIRSYKLREKLNEALWTTHADLVLAKCYTFVVDCSPEEFASKYLKDMLAHVQFFGPGYGSHDAHHLARIDELLEDKATEIDLPLGWWGKIHFRTFDVANRFAFQIKDTREWDYEEVVWIAYTIKSYVEDLGIGIHTEVDLDEVGRAEVKKKLEDRAFYRDNIDWVKEALKGKKLLDLFLRIENHEKYDCNRVGESYEPCKHCGQDCLGGNYYLKGKEQYFEGVPGEYMHALSRHPETYVEKWGHLRQIVRMINDANEVPEPELPVPLQHLELIPEFEAFVEAYKEHLHADAEDFNFYLAHTGGYLHAEEEELEDDPALKKLHDEEVEIDRRREETDKRCIETVYALQRKYDALLGKDEVDYSNTEEWKLRSFWSSQLFNLGFYRLCAPELLEEYKEYKVIVDPVLKLQRG